MPHEIIGKLWFSHVWTENIRKPEFSENFRGSRNGNLTYKKLILHTDVVANLANAPSFLYTLKHQKPEFSDNFGGYRDGL